MTDRYPPVEPNQTGYLDVSDGHRLYWEEVGNPDGIPALYLHGGPGGGCGPGARRSFDPSAYRAILFDQRGCGRSRPLASDANADLSSNTLEHLIQDMEALRQHLKIDQWVLSGGSWGVTLALAYAQRFPHRVKAMVLGCITSGTQQEIDWITRDMGRIFPREWDEFAALVPEYREQGNLCQGYLNLLMSSDPEVSHAAAKAWCQWEDTHVSLMPGYQPSPRYQDPEFRLQFARLVTHYWSHGCFLTANPLWENMAAIADIPTVLIHGRWDVSGPLDVAWKLHQSLANSELWVLEDAGHGGIGFPQAMVQGLNKFRQPSLVIPK